MPQIFLIHIQNVKYTWNVEMDVWYLQRGPNLEYFVVFFAGGFEHKQGWTSLSLSASKEDELFFLLYKVLLLWQSHQAVVRINSFVDKGSNFTYLRGYILMLFFWILAKARKLHLFKFSLVYYMTWQFFEKLSYFLPSVLYIKEGNSILLNTLDINSLYLRVFSAILISSLTNMQFRESIYYMNA